MYRVPNRLSGADASGNRACQPVLAKATLAKRGQRAGFTLVEILIATALTLVLMGMVVSAFGIVNGYVTDSRSGIEMSNRLRSAQQQFTSDLGGHTARLTPPLDPAHGLGYFKIIQRYSNDGNDVPKYDHDGDPSTAPLVDGTTSDLHDVLMFTTRNSREPFVGRYTHLQSNGNLQVNGGAPVVSTVQSYEAEVAYFVRGNVLYRRMLLVNPTLVLPAPGKLRTPTTPASITADQAYYGLYDVSARMVGGQRTSPDLPLDRNASSNQTNPVLVANSLGDLTRLENRYAHQPYAYPHDVGFWTVLGLPTLQETSDPAWPLPISHNFPAGNFLQKTGFDAYTQYVLPDGFTATGGSPNITMYNGTYAYQPTGTAPFDAWTAPYPWGNELNTANGQLLNFQDGTRIAEDVLLTNVIGFDVKVWDPTAPVMLRQDYGADATLDTGDDTYVIVMPGDPGYRSTAMVDARSRITLSSLGAYVDLGYGLNYSTPNISTFSGNGNAASGMPTSQQAVYDTWSTHYERDGVDQDDDGTIDSATDGLDGDQVNGVDDLGEREAPPPYDAPLRGIQIKIRTFEPDSRKVRELTIVQDFLIQ